MVLRITAIKMYSNANSYEGEDGIEFYLVDGDWWSREKAYGFLAGSGKLISDKHPYPEVECVKSSNRGGYYLRTVANNTTNDNLLT